MASFYLSALTEKPTVYIRKHVCSPESTFKAGHEFQWKAGGSGNLRFAYSAYSTIHCVVMGWTGVWIRGRCTQIGPGICVLYNNVIVACSRRMI